MNASLPSACLIQDPAKRMVPPTVGGASLLFFAAKAVLLRPDHWLASLKQPSLRLSPQGSLHDVTLAELSQYALDLEV